MPPASQTGQKLMPLTPISAPIATSAPQAGTSSERNASDSPNASTNTIGSRPDLMVAHEISQSARKIFHSLKAFPAARLFQRH